MQLSRGATLVADYEYIWFGDEALDKSDGYAERYRQYRETGDESHLKFLPGKQPIRWVMRHPRGRTRKRILDALILKDDAYTENHWDFVALCLKEVKGLENDDGTIAELGFEVVKGCERVREKDLIALDEAFDGLFAALGFLVVENINIQSHPKW